MLSLPPSCRYFLYCHQTDMRKGFDGLSGLVREGLMKDPLSGDVFIFFNKRRSHVKLLLWERDGFSIYHKRLEGGRYESPTTHSELNYYRLQAGRFAESLKTSKVIQIS